MLKRSGGLSFFDSRFLTLSAMAMLFAPSALALTQTWKATPGDNDFSLGSNWVSGTAPSTGDTALFNGTSTQTTLTISSTTQQLGSLTFDLTAPAYTIGTAAGNSLRLDLSGTIQIASTFTGAGIIETVNAPLSIQFATGSAGTYTLANNSSAAGSLLRIGGAISGTGNMANMLNLAGVGNGEVAGSISNTSGAGGTLGVAKSGTGAWTLSGINSYTGATTISAGTLTIAGNSTLPNSSAVTQTGTGQLNITASGTYNSQLNLTGTHGVANGDPSANAGALRFNQDGGSFTLGGPIVLSGITTEIAQYAIGGSTVNLNGQISGSGASLILAGGGSGNLTFILGTNETYTGNMTILGKGTASVIVQLGAAGNLPSGALTLQGGNGGKATFDLNGRSQSLITLTTAAPIDGGSATNAVLTSSAAAGQVLTITGGTFSGILGGTGVNNNNFALTSAGNLTLTGTANTYTGPTSIVGQGVLSVSSLANGGVASSIGASSNAASNLVLGGGTLQYTGGTVSIDRSITLSNITSSSNYLDVSTAATNLGISGTISGGSNSLRKIGSGTLTLSGTGSIIGQFDVYGGIVQVTGGSMTVNGDVRTTNDGAAYVQTGGIVTVNNRAVTLSAQGGQTTFTLNGGTFSQTNGGFSFNLGQFGSSYGTAYLNGGTLAVSRIENPNSLGSFYFNGGTLKPSVSDNKNNFISGLAHAYVSTNGGTIDNAGIIAIAINQALEHDPAGAATDGGMTFIGAGATSLARANTYNGGTTLAAGDLNLVGLGTLGAATGSLTVNSGLLNLNGTSQTVGNFTGSGGTIVNNAASGNVVLTIGNGNATGGNYRGSIIDHTSNAGTVALTKTGAGILTLAGNNSYTGATQVNGGALAIDNNSSTTAGRLSGTTAITVNSGGTLLLSGSGSADRINNLATITLAGGTVQKGSGVNEGSTSQVGLGALTLTANSALNYTATAGTLTFDSFNDGGLTLSVTNYLGNGSPGGIDQLIFRESQSVSDLAHFDFGFGAGVNVGVFAIGNGYYEVYSTTPVPEPGTWMAGAFALAAAGFTQRQRFSTLIQRRA